MADRTHFVHVSVRDNAGELILSKNVEAVNGKIDLPELRGEQGNPPAQMGHPVASTRGGTWTGSGDQGGGDQGGDAAGEKKLSPTLAKLAGRSTK